MELSYGYIGEKTAYKPESWSGSSSQKVFYKKAVLVDSRELRLYEGSKPRVEGKNKVIQ